MTHLHLPHYIITTTPIHSLHGHVFKQALTTNLNMWKLTQTEPKIGI